MKTRVYLSVLILFTFWFASCTQKSLEPAKGMIIPGELIGNFLISRGGKEDITYVTTIHCPYNKNSGVESCEMPVGTKVNVGLGVYDQDTGNGKNLDQIWSDGTYEMIIDGRPVDLRAFGTIEITHLVGTIRIWNVIISTNQPGEISARSTGVMDGEAFDYTAKLTFKDQ